MSWLLAAVIGYVLGSAPTANLLARIRGIDLRSEGSTNPGANNARRLGGMGLALTVLLTEAAKGAGSVLVGNAIGGSSGMVVAGIAAVVGNVYNVWYRFQGGKGLGISLGVLTAALPAIVPFAVISMAGLAGLTRSTGKGAVGGLASLVAIALANPSSWLPTPWGIAGNQQIAWLLVGISVVVAPKHLMDARGSD